MQTLDLLRWLHVIGAAVLLGTGAGIAFFMVMANRTRSPAIITHVAQTVVIADALFTATAVVLQLVTGILLARRIGWPLSQGWLAVSIALYIATGLFWLPVVWIQLRLRDMARASAATGEPLGKAYDALFRAWLLCGWPAFLAVMAIVWLMISKPFIRLF